jgi:hypothetical protein
MKVICPKCGEKGSLVAFWVYNARRKVYKPYYRVTHYDPNKWKDKSIAYHTRSCYISKKLVPKIIKETRQLEKEFKRRLKHGTRKSLARRRQKR